jgi:hypothetical protein
MNGIRARRFPEKASFLPDSVEDFEDRNCGIISFTFQRPSDSGLERAFSVTSGERRSLKYAPDMGDHRDDPCRSMVSK